MSFDDILEDLKKREDKARLMGGPDRLAKRNTRGIMNARSRIDAFIDPGSWIETGLLAVSSLVPEDQNKTPADGKVAGFGKVSGRQVGVVSNDFTTKGASSSATNMKKIGHVKRVATERGFPLVFFGESSGARMPDNMGAKGMGVNLGHDPQQYVRNRETPWASAALGQCYGSSAWYNCLADFTVMRKGAIMAVASSGLASYAIGQKVEAEDLGGWKLHERITGLVDRVVETDEEAISEIQRFLSYMPSHCKEPPPLASIPAGSETLGENILDILPVSRTRGYDVRKIIKCIADIDSFFEFKPQFGKTISVGLARLGGKTVGFLASNPIAKAGALDVAGCEKATRFTVMCDSFNIPIILLVDTPGFVIGIQGEKEKAPGKIMNFMQALQMCTVPKFSVIMRKTYGQAYLNMGGGRNSDDVVAWPTAEISFMDPHFATEIVTWGQQTNEDVKSDIRTQMEKDNSAYGLAEIYGIQAVISPAETRRYLIDQLDIHQLRYSDGIGEHRMSAWPTTY
ncbi:MAG: methylmalonyl-CoA carboxyltransferase [Rhodospirillaceae bacterium TMED8]|nr:methylmalonyl-CoA carboxyltransferase [Magnetovibrio sp.]OUT51562.1 MAG: methylmalonyl-CoA carboxyltransferase [Rhodospirillaceae bacterium TMED8]|tara:strand:+ start:2701 stop:4239 length:1539 start_codon:yes stop_codon:yes gene_type:complete